MARITFNLELDSKPDRNGFTAVMVRLHRKDQKPARILTDVKIENVERHWAALDKKRKTKKPDWGKWVVRHIDADALNAKIENEYNRIKKLVEKWQQEEVALNPDLTESTLTPRQIAERYKSRLSDTYFDLAARVLEDSKSLSYRTYVNRQSAINIFAGYAGDDLPLQAVTVPYVEGFQDYLKTRYVSERTGKRLAASSINQYFEALNTIHVDILRLKGHTKKKAALLSPFSDVDQLKTKSAYRDKFNEDQIEKLGKSFPDSNRRRITPEEAFSIWSLSHLLAGMRHGDVLMLRYKHFETDEEGCPLRLTYEMMKTGNVVSIPVLDEAKELLMRWWKPGRPKTDYILPYLKNDLPYAKYLTRDELYEAPFEHRRELDVKLHYWNGQINEVLEEVRKHAGIWGKLKMHNARHSFADLARRIMQEDGSLSIIDITRMLGQSDYRMVMTYIEEMERQDSSKSMQAVFKRKKPTTEPV